MTLNKLKKIITIWLDEVVVNNKVKIRQVGSWKSGENNINRTYDIITDDNSLCGKHINIYIDTYTDINKNETFFTIGFDRRENEIKRGKHKVLTVFSDGRTQWFGDGSDPGDVAVAEHFSNDEIKKLKHMIGDVHEILQNLPEKHHDFDMDEAHAIHITNVIFKECDNIEIRFIANNRIFNSKNKLYIGFTTVDENDDEHNYVFGVTEKHISISNPFSFKFDKAMINPFYEYEYVATFRGYIRPTEEEIINATFRWVVSKEIIKKANRDALFTL